MMRAIFDHALAESPRECCGLIVVCATPVSPGGDVSPHSKYVPCCNLSESPHEQFVLSPEDWAAAEALAKSLKSFTLTPLQALSRLKPTASPVMPPACPG